MASMGVTVDRPIIPTSIELSSEADVADPNKHAVTVRWFPASLFAGAKA